jgi:hypothetical protein
MQVYSGAEGMMAAYGAFAFVAIIIIVIIVIKYGQKKNK